MTVYRLSTARLDMWKAWLTLNAIPTRQVVRDQPLRINDGTVAVTEFATNATGERIHHRCECDGPGHLAKRVNTYDLLELPGDWAATDLVSA